MTFCFLLKPPVPVKRWEGILDATKETPICTQRNPYIHQKEIAGQEDCLYLNVYTPKIPKNNDRGELLPVMVFFHGGGWMCGDSRTLMYGPEYLLDRDVVYVAPNYRLGPLGFLSTQDEQCPGNNGLKDQQEALRWIQKNIHSFGGNNESVTLFGESAGGASVHYHMLSPTSAGLFHKAISQSGTALVPWAEAPPGEARKQALRLAKLLDCPPAPSKKLIDCLRTRSDYDIINTEFSFYVMSHNFLTFYEWDYDPMTPFKAVVEPDLPGAFLVKSPREIPDAPTVPWMTGLTKNEGCLKSVWITANASKFDEFAGAFDAIAPITFYYENAADVDFVTQFLRDKYLNGRKGVLTAEEMDGILDVGVCHADDLMHLFPIYFLEKEFTKKDEEISQLIVDLWTNFATSGDPNKPLKISTKWEPLTDPNKMEKLDIGSDLIMSKYLASRARVWDDLPLWHKKPQHRFKDEL
ncbi:Venom carboxylesterase-6 [Eumeta japonica]|uniref:Carboxylic ester hydrolase n=1 Tax=Eumeta variegata TaxID=151549 RepID=A0A4C1YUX7_EUMVA|nr:Venom carboxylesterase-6 [Eumeta japonica]